MRLSSGAPVAFFDSGVGGLAVVSEFLKVLPNENVVCFADIANMPYGNKTSEDILKFSLEAIDFLEKFSPKLLILACGTVSSVLLSSSVQLESLRFGVPVFDVISPACFDAVKTTKNKRVGIIGTEKTINAEIYLKKLKKIDPKIEIFCKSCPQLASLIEESVNFNVDTIVEFNSKIKKALSEYLSFFKNKGIDTFILGCTHYALVKEHIAGLLGRKVTLIDIGKSVSNKAVDFLIKNRLVNKGDKPPDFRAFVTKDAKDFSYKAKNILKSCNFSYFSIDSV